MLDLVARMRTPSTRPSPSRALSRSRGRRLDRSVADGYDNVLMESAIGLLMTVSHTHYLSSLQDPERFASACMRCGCVYGWRSGRAVH